MSSNASLTAKKYSEEGARPPRHSRKSSKFHFNETESRSTNSRDDDSVSRGSRDGNARRTRGARDSAAERERAQQVLPIFTDNLPEITPSNTFSASFDQRGGGNNESRYEFNGREDFWSNGVSSPRTDRIVHHGGTITSNDSSLSSRGSKQHRSKSRRARDDSSRTSSAPTVDITITNSPVSSSPRADKVSRHGGTVSSNEFSSSSRSSRRHRSKSRRARDDSSRTSSVPTVDTTGSHSPEQERGWADPTEFALNVVADMVSNNVDDWKEEPVDGWKEEPEETVPEEGSVMVEMRENAEYAMAAGLRYSKNGGDQIQPVQQAAQDDEASVADMYLSPRHNRSSAIFGVGRSESDGSNQTGKEFNKHSEPPANATFLVPSDIHPNMLDNEEDVAQLRLLAGQLSADWKGHDFMAPALARRLRDFQFAQEKRRKKYGDERPWGILGLYDHLAAIRMDVEWAEDAAWRRVNGQPYLAWADFEASKNSGINRPFFTYFILFACTAVLIISIGMNGWLVEPLNINPMIGPSAETLIKMGAKETYLIVNENEVWRLASPMVLHAGLIHYFFNMLALWFIGSAVETSHGIVAATILFVIPAIGGTILSAIFLPEYISVGASGGIFGLIGACLADITMNWKLLFSDFVSDGQRKNSHITVLVLLFCDIVVNCLIGLTPFVDNFTHLGGMVFGFLCGLSTMERLSSDFFGVEQDFWSHVKVIFVRFFGLILSVIGIIAALIVLLEGDGMSTPCNSCKSVSCIPFPPWAEADKKWWYCDNCETAKADAITNPETGIIDHISMECPDGTIVVTSLGEDSTTDKNDLVGKLPKYCRLSCPSS